MPKKVTTPTQFENKMKKLAQDVHDMEFRHLDMDYAMCELLVELGYESGVNIFKNTPKWYA